MTEQVHPGRQFSPEQTALLRNVYYAARAACALRLGGRIDEARRKEATVDALLRGGAVGLSVVREAESVELDAQAEEPLSRALEAAALVQHEDDDDVVTCEACGDAIGLPGAPERVGKLSGRWLCTRCAAEEAAGRKVRS